MAYIERSFPLKELGPTIKSAANSKADVYQMYRWWARRPGPQVRSILQLMFWDGEYNLNNYSALDHYINFNDLEGKVILDPFMGGGSTIVEGMKLNAKMIGVDVNPVAWFVTKKETDWIDPEIVKKEFESIREDVGKDLLALYKTRCPECGEKADIMYTFWAKIGKCENCGQSQPLFNNYTLTKFKQNGESGYFLYCPECQAVYFTTDDPKTATCPNCGDTYDATTGNNSKGKCICHHCGFKNKTMDAVKAHSVPPEHVMYALEYYCPHCQSKFFKKITAKEIEQYEKATFLFEHLSDEITALIPEQEIPIGDETKRLSNYGYYHFKDMFNVRQLYCAAVLYHRILKIEDQNLREFFILIHNQALECFNQFCHFNSAANKLEGLFGNHAYHPKINPVENHPIGLKFGRGTFLKYVEKLKKANDLNHKQLIKFKNIATDKSDSVLLSENVGCTKPTLHCTSGEDLYQLKNKSVDAVFTDPPYYDNVMYSELSDFYYVWLKKGLESIYPKQFNSDYTPKSSEIVVNKTRNVGKEQFTKMLTNVFKECNRVLKDDGIAVVVYNHKSTDGWAAIIQTVLDAQFEVKAVYPMLAESTGSLHRAAGNIKYNMTIVLRKRLKETSPISWRTVEHEVYKSVKDQIVELNEQGLSEVDISVIVMGKALEIFSKYYPNMINDDKRVGVDEGLDLLRTIVDYSNNEYLSRLIPDGVNKVDDFYLRHLYGLEVIAADQINLSLRMAGMPIDELLKRKLIESAVDGKREYKILDFCERAELIKTPVTTLDKLQNLANAIHTDLNRDKFLKAFEESELELATGLCQFFENRANSKQFVDIFAYCRDLLSKASNKQQAMF